jgi:hypothetical protein
MYKTMSQAKDAWIQTLSTIKDLEILYGLCSHGTHFVVQVIRLTSPARPDAIEAVGNLLAIPGTDPLR